MKIIKILTISFCIIMLLSSNAFALGEILDTAEDWMNTGYNHAGYGLDTSQLMEGSNDLYNLFLGVATVVAIIVGAMLGIKYMMAGIDEKVQVKQSLFPYFISCIVVFGAFGIWKLVVTVMKEIL